METKMVQCGGYDVIEYRYERFVGTDITIVRNTARLQWAMHSIRIRDGVVQIEFCIESVM